MYPENKEEDIDESLSKTAITKNNNTDNTTIHKG